MGYRLLGLGMFVIGRNVSQGCQDKSTFIDEGMRNSQDIVVHDHVVIEKDVDVDEARPPFKSGFTPISKLEEKRCLSYNFHKSDKIHF